MINAHCTACDACEPARPNGAISAGEPICRPGGRLATMFRCVAMSMPGSTDTPPLSRHDLAFDADAAS